MEWEELLDSNLDRIDIVGYGSLLNQNANSYNDKLVPIVVEGYIRVYNLKLIPDNYTEDWLNNLKKYLIKYGITTDAQIIELNKANKTILNVCETGNKGDSLNGLLTSVGKDDFVEFAKREAQYKLIETDYSTLNSSTCEIIDSCCGKAFILSAPICNTISNGELFLPYHNNVRDGAYGYGNEFGKMFDESTLL